MAPRGSSQCGELLPDRARGGVVSGSSTSDAAERMGVSARSKKRRWPWRRWATNGAPAGSKSDADLAPSPIGLYFAKLWYFGEALSADFHGRSAEMIYLDHNATTPLDPRVLEAMMPFLTEHVSGIAASRHHALGCDAAKTGRDGAPTGRVGDRRRPSRDHLDERRDRIRQPRAPGRRQIGLSTRRRHIVTVATEHRAVLDPCEVLEKQGFLRHLSRCRRPTAVSTWIA